MDAFRNSPPVSRTLAACVFVVSMAIVCGPLTIDRVIFDWGLVYKTFSEIWRPFTCFLLTEKLGIIFVPYSIWSFGGALERDIARFSSSNFVVYLLFVGSAIIAISHLILGPGYVYTDALVLAICWSYAQAHRGTNVHFFVVNIPVMYLPYSMLFITLINSGPMLMFAQAMGIPAAHLYEFLTHYWPAYGGGRNFLPSPKFLQNAFGETSNVKGIQQGGPQGGGRVPGTEIAPANSAFTSGNTWGQRGLGRRLG